MATLKVPRLKTVDVSDLSHEDVITVYVIPGDYYGFDPDQSDPDAGRFQLRKYKETEVLELAIKYWGRNNLVADKNLARHLIMPNNYVKPDYRKDSRMYWPFFLLLWPNEKDIDRLNRLQPTFDDIRALDRQKIFAAWVTELSKPSLPMDKIWKQIAPKQRMQTPDNLPTHLKVT